MKKILFLNGNYKTEFYNNERNKYEGVEATSIFKTNVTISKVIRRSLLKLRIPGIQILFGDWKKDIMDYDIFIISACMYSQQIYKYIRKRTDKRIIHWYWNPAIKEINPQKIKNHDCEVWSFDKSDCKKYDIKYMPTYYFDTIVLEQEEIINDIYFIGADKGRLDKLIKLQYAFEKEGLKTDFHITKSKESTDENYMFKELIGYKDVLKGISKSKAILDYVQQGQSGLTQRPMESIFHFKKLITNDEKIIEYDFYNKNNIFILGKDDIDTIYEFVNSPYISLDKRIIEKYDFGNWLNKIILNVND